MVNVVVKITSRDLIKPTAAPSSSVHRKPYKLCILDQLTPMTYVPMILFYPILDPNVVNIHQTPSHLKTSLSQTLSIYYPFSGRVKDNLYIDDFDAGVPFLEAQINCHMSEFLEHQEIESLNRFVPYRSFCKLTDRHDDSWLPLLAVQVSVFACGGISIGVSVSHKIFDGCTANTLYKCWASFFRGDPDQTLLHPNFDQASSTFPPANAIPEKYLALVNRSWFEKNKFVTRRFVFDTMAIDTLRQKARTKDVPNPTRLELMTCFLWKHAMSSSKYGNTPQNPSVARLSANMRARLKPPMSETVIGNILGITVATYNPNEEDETTDDEDHFRDLVKRLHESNKASVKGQIETFQGEKGIERTFRKIDRQQVIMDSINPDMYVFTSWTKILNEVDFGWGRPVWIGAMGKSGPTSKSFTVFTETHNSKGIEAWVTLEEKKMAIMENDPQFLAFASPNKLVAKQ